MGDRIGSHDWSRTPLGPSHLWPHPLRTLVAVMLASRQPMFIAWGSERIMLYNDGYIPMCGAKHPGALGQRFSEVWADILGDVNPVMEAAYGGVPTHMGDIEFMMVDRKGFPEETHFSFSYTPVHDNAGGVEGMFCVCEETTARVFSARRQAFLVSLSDRLRNISEPRAAMAETAAALGAQLQVARVGYGEIDAGQTFISIAGDWNDGSVIGLSGVWAIDDFGPSLIADLKRGRTIAIADVGNDARTGDPAAVAAFAAVQVRAVLGVPLVKDGLFRAFLFLHHPAPRVWQDGEIALVKEVAERVWDTVERSRAEQHLRLIVSELNHRVKNTLAIVQSMASQTFRAGTVTADARRAFQARLMALAEAHNVLTTEVWDSASLREIVETAVRPHGDPGGRFEISGGQARVEPRWALNLAMALHELCTNATKYGALSPEGGRVRITWSPTPDFGQVKLRWEEHGGPVVAPPTERGFGTKMLERILGGEASEMRLDFLPEGAVFEIAVPVLGL